MTMFCFDYSTIHAQAESNSQAATEYVACGSLQHGGTHDD